MRLLSSATILLLAGSVAACSGGSESSDVSDASTTTPDRITVQDAGFATPESAPEVIESIVKNDGVWITERPREWRV